jgi:hypothetical protein
MMDEFGQRLTALEAKHQQQEIAGLKVFRISQKFLLKKHINKFIHYGL